MTMFKLFLLARTCLSGRPRMPKYEITTVVEYTYEVEADDLEAAKQMGWEYEDYQHWAEVESVDARELDSEDEEEEEEILVG